LKNSKRKEKGIPKGIHACLMVEASDKKAATILKLKLGKAVRNEVGGFGCGVPTCLIKWIDTVNPLN